MDTAEFGTKFASPRRVVGAFYERFDRHEIGDGKGILSDKIVIEASGGVQVKGRAEAARFFKGWFEAFPDATTDVTDIIVSGNTVVTESTFTGTHRGVLPARGLDIAATNVVVRLPKVTHRWQVRQGLIVGISLNLDRLDLLEQFQGQAA